MWLRFFLTAPVVAGAVALASTTANADNLADSSAGSALSYQSTQSTHAAECMTRIAARSVHPHTHLYWHGPHHCWDATPARIGHARLAKPERVAQASHSAPAPSIAAAVEQRPETQQQIAMITDYLAFDMVLEEWRQMSRGLVMPLVDEAQSEFDQRWRSIPQH
jgi:hypothetical protein